MGKLLRYEKGHGRKSANRDSNKRYRLYSDGTVVDQEEGNKIMGFITKDLDEIFALKTPNARQKAIKESLNIT